MGGSGLRLLWKFPGLFETEVTGRRGPFGSCQGGLLSQNRTICCRHCTRLSFRPRLPTSSFAGLRAIGRVRGPRGAEGCAGQGDPAGAGPRGRTDSPALPQLPSTPERKARSDRRGPGAHLIPPHLGRPARAGVEGAGCCSSRTSPGLCIVVCGPDPGCSTPPPALLCAGVLTPAVLGPPPGQDRSPPVPALQRAPPFQIETDKEEVAGCLEVAAGRVPGLLSAAPPSPCEEKGSWEVPGPGAGASSWGAREAWPLSVHCALAWV